MIYVVKNNQDAYSFLFKAPQDEDVNIVATFTKLPKRPPFEHYSLAYDETKNELYYQEAEPIQPEPQPELPKELILEEKTNQVLLNTEYLVIMQELNMGGI